MPRRVTVQAPPTCGNPSATRYKSGCRCGECREAQRVYQRNFYAAKGGNHNVKPEHVKRAAERNKQLGLNWTPARQAAWDRRRLQKLGTQTERFTNPEIFERDGWLCGICEQPVDPALRHPEPMSASLDHVEPLSLGGTHTRDNVRCSHLTCNVKRGNRAA